MTHCMGAQEERNREGVGKMMKEYEDQPNPTNAKNATTQLQRLSGSFSSELTDTHIHKHQVGEHKR